MHAKHVVNSGVLFHSITSSFQSKQAENMSLLVSFFERMLFCFLDVGFYWLFWLFFLASVGFLASIGFLAFFGSCCCCCRCCFAAGGGGGGSSRGCMPGGRRCALPPNPPPALRSSILIFEYEIL